jgi:uncharacterized protein (DUF1810 family)
MEYNLQRFLDAQKYSYTAAFSEIKAGKKVSHWMWFVFPQIGGLGFSETSKRYAIADLKEAELYLAHPVLGQRLVEISEHLLEVPGKSAFEIFGTPDDLKLKSCMTLFSLTTDAPSVFQNVLNRYFEGEKDARTLRLLKG